jgi:hypothetical protein
MFSQLMKIGLFVTLGIWLKHRLRGLVYLFAVLLLTWLLHSEYLAYVERSGNTAWLEWSFIGKWLLVFFSIGLYYLVVERRLGKLPQAGKLKASVDSKEAAVGDGFDFLRNKKQLESQADMSLKKPSGKAAASKD